MENYCINCGTVQQYIGEISDYYYCERCGAKIHGDGGVSYDGTHEGIDEMNDRIREFDYNERRNWRNT